MAENKYWLSQIKLGKWYSNAQYYYRPRNDKERNLMHSCYEEGYNNGFSDGLAEGKLKWHDLRKDPNDLPKVECLIVSRYHNETYSPVHFYLGGKFNDDVIAWCELPKFEE